MVSLAWIGVIVSCCAGLTSAAVPVAVVDVPSHGSLPSAVVPAARLSGAPYAPWAHMPMVWLASRQANQTSELAFVKRFLSLNITVGGVNVDSQWATGDNTFAWNTEKYPNATAMIDEFHALGIRVIAWMTSMIDSDSPNFAEAEAKKYFVYNPLGHCLLKWWHGHGCLLDYTNPEAVEWWHGQMNVSLATGLDGFKCDGTDPYIFELVVPRSGATGRVVTYREYADAYYRDTLAHARSVRGPEALIMSRSVDADWHFAPRDVTFMVWSGDADPDFHGLKGALSDAIRSAWVGGISVSPGDIGGYRGGGPAPNGRTTALFVRWMQLGAFSPVMENGGEGNHGPWSFDTPDLSVTDIYRVFAETHAELVPYLLAAGTKAFEDGHGSIVTPLAFKDYPLPVSPSTFDYLLGNDIFVAPFLDNSTTLENIKFPPAEDGWVDWFDSGKTFSGGEHVASFPCPLTSFPAFKRRGSMIPLAVATTFTGRRDGDSRAGRLTLNVPGLARGGRTVTTEVRDFEGDPHRRHVNPRDLVVTTAPGRPATGRTFGYEHDQVQRTVRAWGSAHEVPVVIEWDAVVVDASATVEVIDDTTRGVRTMREGVEWHRTEHGISVWINHPENGIKLLITGISNAVA